MTTPRELALARERARRERLREQRQVRDQERLSAALDAGDRVQRAPLLTSFATALRALLEHRRATERHAQGRVAEDQGWLELDQSLLGWRDYGLSPAQARLVGLVLQRLPIDDRIEPLDLVERLRLIIGRVPAVLAAEVLVDLTTAGVLSLEPSTEAVLTSLALDIPRPAPEADDAYVTWSLAARLVRDPAPVLLRSEHAVLNRRLVDEALQRKALPPDALLAPDLDLYLTARTVPERLREEQVAALDWRDESVRRQLLHGSVAGDVDGCSPVMVALARITRGEDVASALDLLEQHGNESQAVLARLLRQPCGTDGTVPAALQEDRSVWPLVLTRLGDRLTDVVRAEPEAPFSQWAGLVELRRSVYTRDPQYGLRISEPLVAVLTRNAHGVELRTGRAVLRMHAGDHRGALRDAKKADQLGKSKITKRNLAIVGSERPADRLSPYLVLGMSGDDARDWRDVHAALYRERWRHPEEAAALNWASAALEGVGVPDLGWFTYPIREAPYVARGRGLLRPVATPLPRLTDPLTTADLEDLRELAARSILASKELI